MKPLHYLPINRRIFKLTVICSLVWTSGAYRLDAQVATNMTGSNVCLVYNTSSSSSATGYSPYSYSGKGLVILGPQTAASYTNEYGNSPVVVENLIKRTIQPYNLYKSGKTNMFYKQTIGEGGYGGDSGERFFGLVNMARSNSTKPSHFVAVSGTDYNPPQSLYDYDPFGSASLMKPWTKPNSTPNLPIWIARTLVTSYKFYDLNADRQFDEFGSPVGEAKYLGEGNEARRAVLNSGRTTYSFSQSLTDLVRSNTTLEAAAATVEAWLKSPAGGNHVEEK